MSLDSDNTNILIYDEECFFCSNYIRLLRLRESIENIELVSARDKEAAQKFKFTPSELNEGIVLMLGSKRYVGHDAIYHLALLSTSSSAFNKLNRLIFTHAWLAAALYPALKMGRGIYLAISGKGQIK